MEKSLATVSPKRRRLSPDSFGESFFGQLPESMIEEILLRLPFYSVIGSRCVSKLWRSLTNSRYFIQRWEIRHAPVPSLGILLQHSFFCTEREFVPCFGAPKIKFSRFSLDFLSGSRMNDNDPITVMGSCEDLLLCCNRECFQSDYFVANPITHQWIALPPTIRVHKYVLTGLVCEPASIPEAKKGGELRYRVVRIPVSGQSRTEFNVEIFSSEDGLWNEYSMTWAEGLGMKTSSWSRSGVACNGILYWKFEFRGVIVMGLDPFNPKKKGIRVIQKVTDLNINIYMLGICQSRLRMSEASLEGVRHNKAVVDMNIWELENGNAEWRLVRVVSLPDMLTANSSIGHPWNAVRLSLMTLAFHPSDGDIIYFKSINMNKVICCNLKRMSLEIESGYDLNKSFSHYVDAFPFSLQWWPTPVPSLPKPSI